MLVLPRQARDKHRENSQKGTVRTQDAACATAPVVDTAVRSDLPVDLGAHHGLCSAGLGADGHHGFLRPGRDSALWCGKQPSSCFRFKTFLRFVLSLSWLNHSLIYTENTSTKGPRVCSAGGKVYRGNESLSNSTFHELDYYPNNFNGAKNGIFFGVSPTFVPSLSW